MLMTQKELPGMAERVVGKFVGIADEVYRATPAISKSGLDLLNQSPRKYKHVILDGNKTEATPAMRLGSAFDCLLLEPELFGKRYLVAPDGVRRGTKAWDALEFEANGRELIKGDDLAQLNAMRDAVRAHPIASKLLEGGAAQVSYFWTDPLTGVACKSRADYVRPDGIILDIKTTFDAGGMPDAFQRTALNMRYHCQAAFYSDGSEILGESIHAFLFVVVEKEPPHEVAVYSLEPGFLELGRHAYRQDLDRYARCLQHNTWPGYSTLIQPLAAPAWAYGKQF